MIDHNTIPNGYKRCARCHNIFPATIEHFHRSRKAKGGLCSYCKPCNCAHSQEWYKKNKEKARKTTRAWYDANKESYLKYTRQWHRDHREHDARKMREYRNQNRDRLLKQKREYYHKNKDEIKEKTRTYRLNNPEVSRAARVRRRARIKKASGTFSATDIQELRDQQKGRCWWCGKKLTDYHIDHRIPLVRGGTNELDNICLSCPECNLSKGAKLPHEWCGRLL